jgi:hypothetical protein
MAGTITDIATTAGATADTIAGIMVGIRARRLRAPPLAWRRFRSRWQRAAIMGTTHTMDTPIITTNSRARYYAERTALAPGHGVPARRQPASSGSKSSKRLPCHSNFSVSKQVKWATLPSYLCSRILNYLENAPNRIRGGTRSTQFRTVHQDNEVPAQFGWSFPA